MKILRGRISAKDEFLYGMAITRSKEGEKCHERVL